MDRSCHQEGVTHRFKDGTPLDTEGWAQAGQTQNTWRRNVETVPQDSPKLADDSQLWRSFVASLCVSGIGGQ